MVMSLRSDTRFSATLSPTRPAPRMMILMLVLRQPGQGSAAAPS
jgi:hypothetical protein